MIHFQVSQDLDESLTSLSKLGWVTSSQVSQDLDGWGLERRGSLSSSVDCLKKQRENKVVFFELQPKNKNKKIKKMPC
jgi:hypothetical protein